MDNRDLRERNRKSYIKMRQVKDFTMSVIILLIGLLMFFGNKINALKPIMENKDPLLLNIFGGLCLLYGGFRLYRTITQKDY
ncbi:hypothetical protein ACFSPU_11300 [Haoranjiania flava]|uniref:Uncharacterized protein n=1 Tax=Haoranjiania flava TaxID=1856322 RepID=A0AAE3IKV0_9BACT|nr:hypothetical protein [Haoranjiania flava]MCU7693603.1 hypothetical protein [Haoranjiania flava]